MSTQVGRWIGSYTSTRQHWAVGSAGRYPMCGGYGSGSPWDWTVEHAAGKPECRRCVRMRSDRGIA